MENRFEILTERKTILSYFLLYALINSLLLYYIHDIIITDPQYFTGGNMDSVKLYRKLWMISYFISPFYKIIKLLIISALIYYAIRFIKKLNTQFWGIFYIVLLAQFILLIPDLLELIWFTFIKTNYTMSDVDYFSPLSLASLANHEEISDFLFKLLNSINLFNLASWFLLFLFIKKYLEVKLLDSIVVVLSFYGSSFLVLSFIKYYFLLKIL
ncbi:MAG: hypothetical protein RBT49_07215 [Bacteroidales bacterium]|jgi:hypothetical protein|nr:hypothetical protein [Bacteroidales bacterium]